MNIFYFLAFPFVFFLLPLKTKETKNINGINPVVVVEKNGEILSLQSDFNISGVYPHLTTYTHARINGIQSYKGIEKSGQLECGIGALAEWNGNLYMINYGAHEPNGSEHKLYMIDKNLKMSVYQNSVGGTPAARMIHKESKQLFIGAYVIDSKDNIRVIDIAKMPGRLTAIARHLIEPDKKVYYYDMDGALYEVDVKNLTPKLLFSNPLPGWHGKGAYTAQGKLILANNGENHGSFEPTEHWQVDTTGINASENNGILAEYDGKKFSVVERRQFTDITTKNGINAIENEQNPLWSIGWDKRSLRLKVMENKKWTTYLLPKATYNNDPSHGWFTEWPRIRQIHEGKFMMDMHGMFYDFPSDFSSVNSKGIKPIGSHLRYVPDFIYWNKKIVLATDETSIQGNKLAGQAQSGLWMGSYEELSKWGPQSAYGSIWINDNVKANEPSLPFLFAGFDNKILHLINNGINNVKITIQFDKEGNNKWIDYKIVELKSNGYEFIVFGSDIKAEWIRLISNTENKLTATFHYTDKDFRQSSEGTQMFESLANADYTGEVSHAKMYSNKLNFNLSIFDVNLANDKIINTNEYELSKFDFTLQKGIKDSTAKICLENEIIWSEDESSIVLKSKEYKLRLPKGKGKYNPTTFRNVREVESERILANICGTFYEVPLYKVGLEPLYQLMRPVSTHNKMISDFNTWNGLLILSGVKKEHQPNEHILSNTHGVSMWLGGIDDIWKFGKPVGEGGVWKNTNIKSNEYSDMYLMTGYDKKTLELTADKDTKISVMIYTTHYLDAPVLYKEIQLKAGEKLTHVFPVGFSAHWIQFKSDNDCKATAWLKYE